MKIHCIFLKWSLLLFVMSIPLNASCIPPRNYHTEKIEVACVGNSVTKGY